MSKISKLTGEVDFPGAVEYIFECPGCKKAHMVRVFPLKPDQGWTFNGDYEKPTISPSILVNGDLSCPNEPRCHSFVKEGIIQFLDDCTHELKGQTVKLEDI